MAVPHVKIFHSPHKEAQFWVWKFSKTTTERALSECPVVALLILDSSQAWVLTVIGGAGTMPRACDREDAVLPLALALDRAAVPNLPSASAQAVERRRAIEDGKGL